MIVVVGFIVYNLAFKKVAVTPTTPFDLSSMVVSGDRALPEPSNPCIVIQENLETTRRGEYQRAYRYLAEGLKEQTTYEEFAANAGENLLLAEEISRYVFPDYSVEGDVAALTGYILYVDGSRSRVEAAFTREVDGWRIARMTIVLE